MSDQLIVSAEVHELLGDDLVEAMRKNDPEYRCPICRVHGDFRHEDTSVLVQVHADGQARVLLGHATCIDSIVTHSDEAAPDPSTRDEPEDLIALASLVGTGGKRRPYLFVHTRMPYTLMTDQGDSISPQQAGLLKQGWQLAMGYPEKYNRARGWRLEVDDRGRGRVINDDGAVLLDRVPEGTPEAWFNMARRAGSVSVLFGELGLTDAREGEDASPLVTEACRRGRVVAALVKVRSVERVPGPGAPAGADDRTEAEVGRELAGHLEAALRTRADPHGQDHLNQAESVIDLPTRPALSAFLLEQSTTPWPALLIDLNDPDQERAADTLQKFVDVGLNRDLELGTTMFPTAPDGWGHITWPSQILILAGEDDRGQKQKVLFEPATFPHQWLKGIQTGPMGSMALIVANLQGRDVTPELLEEVSAAGGLAVCSLPGMLATDPG